MASSLIKKWNPHINTHLNAKPDAYSVTANLTTYLIMKQTPITGMVCVIRYKQRKIKKPYTLKSHEYTTSLYLSIIKVEALLTLKTFKPLSSKWDGRWFRHLFIHRSFIRNTVSAVISS